MTELIFPDFDLNGIKGVLIDIDDTLYPYEPAHQKALRACYKKLTTEEGLLKRVSFKEFEGNYRSKRMDVTKRLESQGACRSRLFAFQAIFEEQALTKAFSRALCYENIYWDTFIDNMKVCVKAKLFLEKCKSEQIKVCAVSDMQAHFQIRKIEALGLSDLIDYLTTSEEAGCEKPGKRIFERALNKLNIEPFEALMVGDHELKDINGAEKNGIKAIRVKIKHATAVC